MNLIAPFARRCFIRNHGILMQQGAEGLAGCSARPWWPGSIDLMAD